MGYGVFKAGSHHKFENIGLDIWVHSSYLVITDESGHKDSFTTVRRDSWLIYFYKLNRTTTSKITHAIIAELKEKNIDVLLAEVPDVD